MRATRYSKAAEEEADEPDRLDEEDRRRMVEEAAEAIDVSLTDAEVDELAETLGDYAGDAAEAGYAQVGGDSDDMFNQVHDRAAEWAEDRAAELVTEIDDTTRDAVRSAVADGLADGLTADEIADRIEGIDDAGGVAAFSEDRAELIADTEIASANSQGALIGYKSAADNGVDVLKEWLITGDACDLCQDAADQGPIELDAEFDSVDTDAPPGHPRCRCALSPVVQEKSEDDGEQD